MKKLKDVLPYEFFREYTDTGAYKMKEEIVLSEVDGTIQGWPGEHKFVFVWWILKNGYAVGWNENPGRGWSFPVIKIRGRKI